MDMEKTEAMAQNMRRDMLDMALACGGSVHLGGALSCVDILAVLYGSILRYRANDPRWEARDRFLLSKGHVVLAYYAALYEAGFFPREVLDTFQQNGTRLGAHPVMDMELGVESSNGSLGQGLSFGVGMALMAQKRQQAHRVFVLLGNGECNEGMVWEAVMSAAQFGLDGLVAIVDDNHMQSDGNSSAVMGLAPLEDKFAAFGWNSISVADGHDHSALQAALAAPAAPGRPTAIVAHTVKGKGLSFAENAPEWHHNRLTQKLYEQALTELGVG